MDRSLPALVRPQDHDIATRLLRRATWNDSGCLIWSGAIAGRGRYGLISVKKWAPPGRKALHRMTHRVAYQLFVGPVPEGMEIDHVCHSRSGCDLGQQCPHRLCLNPAHLEAVTHTENVLRGTSPSARHAVKTHCKEGHPLSGDNLYVIPSSGGRQCRICRVANRAVWKQANRVAINATNRAYRSRKRAAATALTSTGA